MEEQEKIEVKPTWQGLTREQLRPWVVEKAQEAQNFHKAIQGKPDIAERLPFLESKYKEVEDAAAHLQKLDNAHIISQRLAEKMKTFNEPAPGQVPFENSGGEPRVSITDGKPTKANFKSLDEVLAGNHAVKSIGQWQDVRQPFALVLPDYFVSFQNPEVKTVMARAAGYAPANDRTSKLVPAAQRQPRLADLIPVHRGRFVKPRASSLSILPEWSC